MRSTCPTIGKASLAFLLAVAAAMPTAFAQHPRALARATVPFAFEYGSSVFPAGSYTFGVISDNVMTVHGPGRSALGVVAWSDQNLSGVGKLVFHRDGEQLTLQEIWLPQLSARLHCPAKKHPKQADVAATQRMNSDVEVALVAGDR